MKISLAVKIMLFNALLIIITSGALISYSYVTAKNDLEFSLGSRLEAIAATGALMLDGDRHDLIKGPEDETSEAFVKLRDTLRAIKIANNLQTEVYTFRREGDKLKFIVMTNEKSYIGHEYEIKEAMWPALNEGKTSHTTIYRDANGYWLSAYAPIFDSHGSISGILDVDIELKTFQAEVNRKIYRLVMVSSLILLLSLVMGLLLSNRLVKQLKYLRDTTEKISLGQMERSIRVTSRDEVGELAESLERMRKSLKLALSMIEEKEDDEA